MKTKMGRPRKGKNLRAVVSIRLEPKVKKRLIKDYGSIQEWIDKVSCLPDFLAPAFGRREGTSK
jgi:hypothetical protein